MPAWAAPGSEEDSWKLVHFIRHLPRVTPEELIEMESLNPRSAGERRELEEEERFLGGHDDEPHQAQQGERQHVH